MCPLSRPRSPRIPSPSVEPASADRMRRGLRWGIVMALALVVACSSSTVSGIRELAISITATPTTAAVNTPVEFRYDAMGTQLAGIVVAYGDGVVDSVATFGASTAGGRLTHTYSTPGIFQVEATVIEGSGDRASNSTSVEITP